MCTGSPGLLEFPLCMSQYVILGIYYLFACDSEVLCHVVDTAKQSDEKETRLLMSHR